MPIQHLDPEQFVQAYGVDLQVVDPWKESATPPFGAVWAVLAPGEKTKHHQHQELESFVVARGEGIMTIDGESEPVRSGSVVFHLPFQEHTLENTSETEDLLFMSLYWEDRSKWSKEEIEARAATAASGEGRPTRVMVTAAPPTPNGDLHLGHFSGPYLSADYYTRYLELRGVEGAYACGSDDHCMYVERMGESMGMTGEEAADHFVGLITESLTLAGVDMDVFIRPGGSSHFEPRVRELFDKLYESGKIELREGPSPYCESDGCKRYLFEADISGGCPHCGEGVTGNTCEACGLLNDSINLVEPRCTKCGEVPTTRTFKRLIFPLGDYAERLTACHEGAVMNARLRAFCEKAIAAGLPDVAVSHISDWGLRVPVDDPDLQDQTLYVWFEMAARYFAYAEHVNDTEGVDEGYGRFWRSQDAEIVQFFGFDNSFYYAIFLPALYVAFDESLRLPTAFVTNEFYRLDGEKFSTSRNHRILGRELLGVAPRDVVRFFLAWSCPEREETNFTVADFTETVERELVRGIQPWLEELSAKLHEEYDGIIPATGDWTKDQLHFMRRLEALRAAAAESYEPSTFSPQRLTRTLSELVREARRFGKGEMAWKEVAARGEERRSSVALEILAAKLLAILAAPVMPEFSDRLWHDLGHAGPLAEPDGHGVWEAALNWVPAGQAVEEGFGGEYFATVRGCLDDQRSGD